MMLAAAVGAMVAVGIVFLIEYLDDTIKTPDDVQRVLGLNVLGTIGQVHAEGEWVVIDQPRSPVPARRDGYDYDYYEQAYGEGAARPAKRRRTKRHEHRPVLTGMGER